MLIEFKLESEKIFPSQIKGKYAFLSNVILIIKNLQGKTLFIDCIKSHLGSYSPPAFLQNAKFYYEIVRVPEEYIDYIDCIAKAIEDKLHPVLKNSKLRCGKEVTVVINV